MNSRRVVVFSIYLALAETVYGTMLPDSAVISEFRKFVSGKTICCATPLEVLYGISLFECGKHCLSHPGCTVLSYQRRSLQCRLFDVDPTDSSFLEVDSTFAMVPVTRLTEEMISPCSRSHCSGFNKCAVTDTTSVYCDPSVELLNEWRLVYETDDDGDVVSGREGDLISAFQSASSVRVYVPSWNQTFRIDATKVAQNSICSQSLFQVAKETWNSFSSEATRVFYIFCTSGDYHKSLHYLYGSSRPSDPDIFGVIGIKWFIRKSCRHRDNYPVYCHDDGGQETCGSLSNLDSAIRQGYEISFFARNGWTASPLDQIVLKDGPLISAQQLRRLETEVLSSGGTFTRRFIKDNPLWSYDICRSDGIINRLTWYIGGDKKDNFQSKKYIDWFADTCWSMIYSHNQEGVSLDGFIHRLRASIMAGRRIRVVLNGKVAGEPDSVIVETDGHINAQLLTEISVTQQAYFQSNPYWYWQMISTAGFRHILRLYLESYNNRKDPEKSTVSVQWYADTRPWRKLLTISASGTVTTGSKEVLSRSLKLGGMLRLVVTFSNNTVMAFTADSIEFFGSEVSAQFVRYIGHIQKPDSSDRMFAPDPHWNLILVTTEGRLTSSLWDVKDNRHISTNTLNVTCSWFVN